MADFRFAVSYHSFGQLLLYPQGWQTLTMSADDPIYMALSGTDDDPAIEDFNPGVGADLYTTNGEFTDWAHGEAGVLAWTPELSQGCEPDPDCDFGFEFPDDEALVQAEFERNLDFAVNVAKSATDPEDPESHTGLDTQGLYLNAASIDPWKTNWTQADLRVDVSYAGGSSQPVEVLAKRAGGAVALNYRINGGGPQSAPHDRVARGRRLRGQQRVQRLLPIPPRRDPRSRDRRLGGVLVHARGRFDRARHLRRGRGRRRRRPRGGGRGPNRGLALSTARPGALISSPSIQMRSRQRAALPTSTTSTPWGGLLPTTWASSATTKR